MIRQILMGAAVAGAIAAGPGLASAAFVSADFRAELDLPNIPVGARVLEALMEPVAGAPDLSAANEIANPAFWDGSASTDLDASGLLTLTGDHEGGGEANYDLAVFTISNIVFDAGEIITGVSVLVEGLLDPGFSIGVFAPTISFTANSVTISYDQSGAGGNADFQFLDGGASTFQVNTSTPAIPLPAALPLMAGALGLLAVVARRRKAA